MKIQRPQLSLQHAQRVLADHLTSLRGRSYGSRSFHRATIGQFLQALTARREPDYLDLDEWRLLEWLMQDMSGRSIERARKRLGIVASFLRTLVREGLLRADPLADFRIRHGNASWRVLAEAFQAADPLAALAALREEPAGPIETQIVAYLKLHQSLGKAYRTHRFVLQNLNRFLRLRAIDSPQAITSELVRRWLESRPDQPPTRHEYLGLVGRFFEHLKQAGVVAVNPVVAVQYNLGRRPRRAFRPFIFTHEQIAAILSRAQQLHANARFPLRGPACHAMLALLYSLGLRHGEARRLQIQDLDWGRQTLLIRETKFHKSRYVPFGPKVGQCLGQFLDLRRTVLVPVRNEDPIFVASSRTPMASNVLLNAFRVILKELEITNTPGARPPRLHDLRHTFAVHRLLRWYRNEVNVQSRLMALSTFLGHLDPRYTQIYLTITDDLLGEASERFYKHFGQTLNEEACA